MTARPTIDAAFPDRQKVIPRLFSALLVSFAATIVGVGIADAWLRDRDGDMQRRESEYRLFRDGIYPDPAVEKPPAGRKPVRSVYPPWALPLFTVFFEPGGKLQGRLVIEALSLTALMTMGWYGWCRLRPHGIAPGLVGAVVAAAIVGNASALALGQFSIICMGFVAAEMLLLEAGRPVAAGFCWALAMLKPQIGIAFAPLLLTKGRGIGLVAGVALLAALSLAACAWTDVHPSSLLDRWLVRNRLEFNGHAGLQNAIQAWTGLSQRTLVAIGMGLVASVAGVLLLRTDSTVAPDALRLAAPLAAVGMLAVYHRHYDNVMLWPTMLALLERAIRTGDRADVAISSVLAATLLVHPRLVGQVPFWPGATVAVWAFAAWWLVRRDRRSVDPRRGTT